MLRRCLPEGSRESRLWDGWLESLIFLRAFLTHRLVWMSWREESSSPTMWRAVRTTLCRALRLPAVLFTNQSDAQRTPVSLMAESGTIADIQVSVRQITQQSLVSCWYEMRACSSQSLLSSDWTLASKMVGRGGRKPHVSVWRGRQLSSLFFGYVSFVVVIRAVRPRQRALMQCLWIEHQHSRTQNPVCIVRWRNQCLKACVYRRQLY